MFSRLLKHEWKANAKVLGILSLAACGIGVAATIVLRFLLHFGDLYMHMDNIWPVVVAVALGMFLFFSAVALSLYVIAVQFILLYRFYKNKFTDEGYLTFTLPVKTTHIFWSSFVNMLLWLLIAMAVVAVIIVMVILFGTVEEGLINTDVFEWIRSVFTVFQGDVWEQLGQEIYGSVYVILAALRALVSPFYALFVPMCCITIGAVLAKKHKILASFGIYYAVNFVVGIITSVSTVFPALLLLSSENMVAYNTASAAIQLVITAGLTLGAYFMTIHLMKKKLNLP